jgi:ABC-type hemin transport system substrate-binding protein
VLNDIIAQKSIQLSTKDTIIISLNQKIINFGSIINTKDQQQSLNTQLVKDLEKALKRQKRRTFFYKVGTGIGAVVTLILLAN